MMMKRMQQKKEEEGDGLFLEEDESDPDIDQMYMFETMSDGDEEGYYTQDGSSHRGKGNLYPDPWLFSDPWKKH